MRAVIATPRAISQAISKYYAPGTRDDAKPYAKAAEATTVVTKGGKPASKSSDTAKPKPAAKAAANVPFDQLPEDQKAQRKQIGLIAMAWSILIPCFPLLLYGVWPAARITLPGFIFQIPWLAILTAPATIFYVTQKYWK